METMPPLMNDTTIRGWVAVAGNWDFKSEYVEYLAPDKDAQPPIGLALSNARLRRGTIGTTVQFDQNIEQEGRILFGYKASVHPLAQPYYSAGIGGHGFAYTVQRFDPNQAWQPVAGAGSSNYFTPNAQFKIQVAVRGQKIALTVDDIKVLEANLPTPLNGDQVGLFAVGKGRLRFTTPVLSKERPKLFVVTQYGEPYDALFNHVIEPLAEKKGLFAFRAKDIYKPGFILSDIIESVVDSEIIVAEITPGNPNVFYELGYAHALKKTAILLADTALVKQLPFDISGYRVIFYDNTIKGKSDVDTILANHLSAVLEEL